MRSIQLLAAVLLAALPAGTLAAQQKVTPTGSLPGTLISPEGRPVYKATVSLIGTDLVQITDRYGYFEFLGVASGIRRLRVVSAAYPEQEHDVMVRAGLPLNVTLPLSRGAQTLPDIRVVGEQPTRRPAMSRSMLSMGDIMGVDGRDRMAGYVPAALVGAAVSLACHRP